MKVSLHFRETASIYIP